MHRSKIIKYVSTVEIGLGLMLLAIATWLALDNVFIPGQKDPHSVARILGWLFLLASFSLVAPGIALRFSVKIGLALQSLIIIFLVLVAWLWSL